MRRSGEITVFLSMCLLCVSALLCVMLESARTAGSRYYFQVAANGALDTLFSRYHRQLWEEYRILALEYGSEEELTEELAVSINQYLDTANWYPMKLESVNVAQLTGIADQGGGFLAEEVLSYMKFGAASQFMIRPEEGEQFFKDVAEAVSVDTLSGLYGNQEKEVQKLEQAAENLITNIREQERLREEIGEALWADEEEKFFSADSRYRKAVQRYPKLMEQYEKQVNTLAEKQQESRRKMEEAKPGLQEGRGELLEQQWNPYDTYLAENGQRRQEFIIQKEAVRKNLDLLDQVENLVEELVRAEAERGKAGSGLGIGDEEKSTKQEEGGKENGENEEGEEVSLALAARLWDGQYMASKVSMEAGFVDTEKRNLLEKVRGMAEGGLLKLVLPEDMDISQETLSTGRFPSRTMEAGKENGNTPGNSFMERVLINEYCGHFFPNALSQDKHPVQYELEYILQGAETDRENLEKTVSDIFAVRTGLNLLHILSDAQKREEARALALGIAGGAGLAPLAEIMACLVMSIWAAGESVQDLRILMSGGNIPLWKQRRDWKVSLEGLLDMGRGQMPEVGGRETSGQGFSYEGYLKLLLLKEEPDVKHMRMLDLMQQNIGNRFPGFLIRSCAYRVDIQGAACGKHVFFTLPIVEGFINGTKGYSLEAVSSKAY